MADERFQPIKIVYDGIDADANLVDLGQLGQSLQGAARLLGTAGHIVVTGHYGKKAPALSVRVLAKPVQAGSVEITAILMTLAPFVTPLFPTLADKAIDLSTKAVEAIVNYAIASFSKNDEQEKNAHDVAVKSLEEMGHTSRTAIEAMARVAEGQRAAVRLFATPVGESVATARIGEQKNGAIVIDAVRRAEIDSLGPIEVSNESVYEILFSELDLKNRSCKFRFKSEEEHQRFNGEITDPLVLLPNNPYSTAMDSQRWLRVRGKLQTRDGDIEKLYISDTDRSPAHSPALIS
jgi:hypothetical protein